jgi:hypothetical protein
MKLRLKIGTEQILLKISLKKYLKQKGLDFLCQQMVACGQACQI